MAQYHIGTSGWSYPEWRGRFYPAGLRPAKYLEYYASRFDCTELNASFYGLPAEKTVQGWAGRTPPGFVFCLKLSRLITHTRKLAGVGAPLDTFFQRFRPLENRCGPILIQLPSRFSFELPRVEGFLELLTRQYPRYRFALEARHVSWLTPEAINLLKAHRVALVMAEAGSHFPYFEMLTTDFVYMRCHGPGELYASPYSEAALSEFAAKIREWVAQGQEVWVFFNNTAAGHATGNALALRDMLVTHPLPIR